MNRNLDHEPVAVRRPSSPRGLYWVLAGVSAIAGILFALVR
jgi:hypothetical protein